MHWPGTCVFADVVSLIVLLSGQGNASMVDAPNTLIHCFVCGMVWWEYLDPFNLCALSRAFSFTNLSVHRVSLHFLRVWFDAIKYL